MSVQTEQPLIWLARILQRSAVSGGRVEVMARPAELRYFWNFSPTGLP